jgi:hypothetical protein
MGRPTLVSGVGLNRQSPPDSRTSDWKIWKLMYKRHNEDISAFINDPSYRRLAMWEATLNHRVPQLDCIRDYVRIFCHQDRLSLEEDG